MIHIANWRRAPRLPTPLLRAMARAICRGLTIARPELSLTFCDDATIAQINATWRDKPRPTDVLSFPQDAAAAQLGRGAPLGDVVVSMPTAARQAARCGHGLDAEVARLLVHGVLHLLGHDHVHGGRQAGRMRREETRLLALLEAELGLKPAVGIW